MTDNPDAAMIEAVARALSKHEHGDEGEWQIYYDDATTAVAAARPFIEAQERARIVAWLRNGKHELSYVGAAARDGQGMYWPDDFADAIEQGNPHWKKAPEGEE